MRIVSQDGMLDVPYEISALSIGGINSESTIYIRSKLLDEKPCVFATYSTEAKVLKVMEMLRTAYREMCLYNTLNNGTAFELAKTMNAQQLELARQIGLEKFVFKFPSDEDLEV